MMSYIRIGRLCAFHVEWSWQLTARPLWARQVVAGEIVVDLPFCRIIFTPGRRLFLKKRLLKTDAHHDEAANPSLPPPAAGTAGH